MNKRETVKAWAGTIVTVGVAVGSACGVDIDAEAAQNVVCAVVLVGATAYGCWKNHNFTWAAQEGQKLVNDIKSASKAVRRAERDGYGAEAIELAEMPSNTATDPELPDQTPEPDMDEEDD